MFSASNINNKNTPNKKKNMYKNIKKITKKQTLIQPAFSFFKHEVKKSYIISQKTMVDTEITLQELLKKGSKGNQEEKTNYLFKKKQKRWLSASGTVQYESYKQEMLLAR